MTNPSLSGRGKSLKTSSPEPLAKRGHASDGSTMRSTRAGPAQGRPRRSPIIDIGSNSVRLVAYEGLTRAPTPIYNEKVLCGLGRDVATTGRLDDEAVAARAEGAARASACSAETMRRRRRPRARDRRRARRRERPGLPRRRPTDACGCPVELLSGAREAELSALGVISGFHQPDGVVGDLGGGSLELVDVAGDEVGARRHPAARRPRPAGPLAAARSKKARKIVREALERRRSRSSACRAAPSTRSAAPGARSPACTWPQRDYPLHVMHGYTHRARGRARLPRARRARGRRRR